MKTLACLAVAVSTATPPALATTILVSRQDDHTLSGTTYYEMVINNGRHMMSASGFGTAITFNSSDYSFSLTNYNPALMTMISATLDLERLTSSTMAFGAWSVSPDPNSSWRPNVIATASTYTFVTVSAPIALGGSGASHSFGLGPNTPVSGYNMMALFGSDLAGNHPIQITWRQSFTSMSCYDGSCGGTPYNRNWTGEPGGRLYDLSVTGNLHTYVEADLILDDGVPEPATISMLGGGLLALGCARRFSRRISLLPYCKGASDRRATP